MKKMLLTGILILLLFVGTAAAVGVNYAQAQTIPLNTARDNANSALVSYVAQGKLGSSAALWKGATLSQAPIIIYDESGVVYSYLFDVVNKDGTIVGQVNAAGNKIVGTPVISIEKSPRSFDPGVIIPEVRELALEEYPESVIDYIVFVTTKEQKFGVMAILSEEDGLTHRLVYDMQTYKLRSERIAYRGLVDASTPSSVFVSMSSASATRAIQSYDSKTKTIARVVPVMRRVIPINYIKTTNAIIPGTSTVKSTDKEISLSDYQTTVSLTIPKEKAPVSSSKFGQPLSVARFLPV